VQRQSEWLRHEAERRAEGLETRLRGLLNRLDVGVFRASKEGALLEANPAFLRLLGAESIEEAKLLDLRELFASLNREAPREGQTNVRLRRVDGRMIWVSLSRSVTSSSSGQPLIEGLIEEITDRKEAEDQLRKSELRYRMLTEAVPQLVWSASPSGEFLYVSRQWFEYTGKRAPELVDGKWIEYVHPDDRTATIDSWKRAVAEGASCDIEHRIRKADGSYRWFKTRGVVIRDSGAEIVGWLGTCTDIEDSKRSEAFLMEADRRKDEFLAMLSHELRNPLNAINSAAQMLQRRADEGSRAWCESVIQRQVKRLTVIIDDLLDVSRITRGKIKLRKERVKLARIISSAVDTVRVLMDERRHQFVVTMPTFDVWIDGDTTRLEQMVNNLLTNSAKYTDVSGKIWLTAAADGKSVRISVRDTGVGIAPEVIDHIFEPFMQVDRTLDRSQGGLGIGLTLVRMLAEMHGGTVTASSDGVGKGSEFTVTLPCVEAPQKAEDGDGRRRSPRSSGPHRVLIVEDNDDSAYAMERFLQSFGHEVRRASNGREALQVASVQHPDVVLLDIGLPGMDGYELATELRKDVSLQDTLVIAVTGYGQERDRERSKGCGVDYHIVKPLDYDLLLSYLGKMGPGHSKGGIAETNGVG
jgi:PAS domain S-box-containing protein